MNIQREPLQTPDDWESAALLACEQRDEARAKLQQVYDLCNTGWADFNGLAMVAVADLHLILEGPP